LTLADTRTVLSGHVPTRRGMTRYVEP
jgi:hypothetical protein